MNAKVAKRLRKVHGWRPSSERVYCTVGQGASRWSASTQNSSVVPTNTTTYLPLQTRKFFYTALPSTGRVISSPERRNYKEAKRQYKALHKG